MVYKKSYKKKTYSKKSTSWYDKKYSAMQIAKKALDATKYIKGLVNSEMLTHFVDISTPANVPTTGLVYNLINIGEGDTEILRTGISILGRSIYIDGRVLFNASATYTTVKAYLFWDKQQVAGTGPSMSDIIDTSNIASPYLAPLNHTTRSRFQMLDVQTFELNNQHPMQRFYMKHTFQKHIRFYGANSTDVQGNGLYLLLLSNEGAQLPQVAFASQFNYHDN